MNRGQQFRADGAPDDGVGHDFATEAQLGDYTRAQYTLSQFKVPPLIHAANPHERLYVAAFDGTGNHKYKDPEHATNVARIHDQISELRIDPGTQVYTRYAEGPGTQDRKIISLLDNATGFTYEERLEKMYDDLVDVAQEWRDADPHTVIRVHAMGFSRGASQAAGFTRLVHERGIPVSTSLVVDEFGKTSYSHYIAKPGEIFQTVGLFDPVATGAPMKFDRRLPPSVVSGLQITAGNEKRASFPSDQILPPGLSEDGRFLNLVVPGAHSDIGGGYLRNGLAARCHNLMVDYCNGLRDEPFLRKIHETRDPRLNVVHRSTEGVLLFRLDPRSAVRGTSSGTNLRLVATGVSEAGSGGPAPVSAAFDARSARTLTIMPSGNGGRGPAFPFAYETAMIVSGKSSRLTPLALGAAGALATAYDVGSTVKRARELDAQGNKAGFDSLLRHTVSREMGMLAGARLGAGVAALGGSGTGPGMFLFGLAGGLAGAVAGDKVADAIDRYRVYRQKDPEGITWTYDPDRPEHGWTHEVPALPGAPAHTIHAPADLSGRLDFQAATTYAELSLASPAEPRDPYRQPATADDTPSVAESPWVRDGHTHAWSRHVVDRMLEHGMSGGRMEMASAGRAARLDQSALQTSRENQESSSLAVAQRFKSAYEEHGWHVYGPLPRVVSHTLGGDMPILASDGRDYRRGDDGQWVTPGRIVGSHVAEGNVHDELDAALHARSMRVSPPAITDERRDPSVDEAFQRLYESSVRASAGHARALRDDTHRMVLPADGSDLEPVASREPFGSEAPFEDGDMNDLWFALQANDHRAVMQACARISESAACEPMWAQVDALRAQQRIDDARQETDLTRADMERAVVAPAEAPMREPPVLTLAPSMRHR